MEDKQMAKKKRRKIKIQMKKETVIPKMKYQILN